MNHNRQLSGNDGQSPLRDGWTRILNLGPGYIYAIAVLITALGGGYTAGRFVPTSPNNGAMPTQAVTQTVTQTVTASPSVSPTAYYIGHIVEWVNGPGQPNTSWLVGSNGERYWIPNASVFFCLLHEGHTDLGPQSSAVLNDLPDSRQRASAGTCRAVFEGLSDWVSETC